MFQVVMKKMFFDSPGVLMAIGRRTGKVLSRFGAYVRQRARTSIRRRKAVSQPGQPPSSHAGLLRDWILFGYDRNAQTVVIGPLKINARSLAVNQTGAELLEYGGMARIPRNSGRGRRTVRIRPRPYMHPAFEREKSRLPALWAASVR